MGKRRSSRGFKRGKKKQRVEADPVRWVGKVVAEQGGNTFYEEIKLDDDTTVQVGEFVSVLVTKDKFKGRKSHHVAVVESMWETEEREKCFEARWFMFPSECRQSFNAHENELYEAGQVDVCTIESIEEKVRVTDKANFVAIVSQDPTEGEVDFGSEIPDLFFCEYFYNEDLARRRKTQFFEKTSQKYAYSKMLHNELTQDNSELQLTNGDTTDKFERDPFLKAQSMLQLSAVPKHIPCRESELQEVRLFLEEALARGGGGSLYISGMPGTGKTATVMEAIRSLKQLAVEGKQTDFDFVEINGLKVGHAFDAYSLIYRSLAGVDTNYNRASQHLEQLFSGPSPSSPKGRPCILLVDELDAMVTRKQTLLYNLFDWPSRTNSWLTCIGIANTMDLPERLLPRIHSRMGMNRVVFNSYSHEQLKTIIADRMTGLEVFKPGSIEMCAKMVASVSGDIRRALQICRKAVEICQERVKGERICMVEIEDIKEAYKPLRESVFQLSFQGMSIIQKLICIAVYKAQKMSGDKASFDSVLRTLKMLVLQLGTKCGLKAVGKDLLSQICVQLERSGVLSLSRDGDELDFSLYFGPEIGLEEVQSICSEDSICNALVS